ncbi:reverse transcriptase domain-containing protein [Nephila pilipes]|uniref:Reverse transcriptase domain-containing protein n=1 Tax=Nephila pilipes TaxID=299642 RepID=A0A8X6TV86_NEPPI|nr:reverse transcriptase domain-containing protein [Nephila pilipes]
MLECPKVLLKIIINCKTAYNTLRLTYLTLIRPIFEYGFPIYCCASNSVLKKLEQVQLSSACIITGLKHSCPSNIVLLEADVQPLLFRRQNGLTNFLASANKTKRLST